MHCNFLKQENTEWNKYENEREVKKRNEKEDKIKELEKKTLAGILKDAKANWKEVGA